MSEVHLVKGSAELPEGDTALFEVGAWRSDLHCKMLQATSSTPPFLSSFLQVDPGITDYFELGKMFLIWEIWKIYVNLKCYYFIAY